MPIRLFEPARRRIAAPRRIAAIVLASIVLCLAGGAVTPAAATTAAQFDGFVDKFLDGWYAFRPVEATRAGVHKHDATWAGYTRESIDAEVVRLEGALTELKG